MRLVTRSDFDGLACGALLKEAGIIDHWKFAHPKDLQDGLVPVDGDDCLANVPYVPGCGLWFDHHSSEYERLELAGKYKGESRIAPSCARIIYDYYGGEERFPQFTEMMAAVDKVDSANLTIDEIQNPTGWILIGYLMDPRTGLGRWRDFTISNYQLMEKLIDACRTMTTDDILALPDVVERIELYQEQTTKFVEMVKAHTRTQGKVIISDLRGVDPIYSGNRFMIYSMYPEQNISAWIVSGRGGQGCSAAVGYSILNDTATLDVGSLMLKYQGGGHRRVGTCQFSDETMETGLSAMLDELCALANE
ncbi:MULTISPECIES: exopolyphosphatase [Eubacterium]|uniref:NanoRNase/pAp phosphatase, hydrolyzes c-di-AMP and oligoRNAs n=1 Tax=Eubacterium barkeri TaxID=1528 RepID=A0A1H3HN79_EUBBA|nr:exopolyphosphatase [Eubacterium barkeri]SDY16238.1 nanoRNase/pAp phosphatase, hydrolyzes c-di-AMP and oligoRNAs [Eubacterium barkeri]